MSAGAMENETPIRSEMQEYFSSDPPPGPALPDEDIVPDLPRTDYSDATYLNCSLTGDPRDVRTKFRYEDYENSNVEPEIWKRVMENFDMIPNLGETEETFDAWWLKEALLRHWEKRGITETWYDHKGEEVASARGQNGYWKLAPWAKEYLTRDMPRGKKTENVIFNDLGIEKTKTEKPEETNRSSKIGNQHDNKLTEEHSTSLNHIQKNKTGDNVDQRLLENVLKKLIPFNVSSSDILFKNKEKENKELNALHTDTTAKEQGVSEYLYSNLNLMNKTKLKPDSLNCRDMTQSEEQIPTSQLSNEVNKLATVHLDYKGDQVENNLESTNLQLKTDSISIKLKNDKKNITDILCNDMNSGITPNYDTSTQENYGNKHFHNSNIQTTKPPPTEQQNTSNENTLGTSKTHTNFTKTEDAERELNQIKNISNKVDWSKRAKLTRHLTTILQHNMKPKGNAQSFNETKTQQLPEQHEKPLTDKNEEWKLQIKGKQKFVSEVVENETEPMDSKQSSSRIKQDLLKLQSKHAQYGNDKPLLKRPPIEQELVGELAEALLEQRGHISDLTSHSQAKHHSPPQPPDTPEIIGHKQVKSHLPPPPPDTPEMIGHKQVKPHLSPPPPDTPEMIGHKQVKPHLPPPPPDTPEMIGHKQVKPHLPPPPPDPPEMIGHKQVKPHLPPPPPDTPEMIGHKQVKPHLPPPPPDTPEMIGHKQVKPPSSAPPPASALTGQADEPFLNAKEYIAEVWKKYQKKYGYLGKNNPFAGEPPEASYLIEKFGPKKDQFRQKYNGDYTFATLENKHGNSNSENINNQDGKRNTTLNDMLDPKQSTSENVQGTNSHPKTRDQLMTFPKKYNLDNGSDSVTNSKITSATENTNYAGASSKPSLPQFTKFNFQAPKKTKIPRVKEFSNYSIHPPLSKTADPVSAEARHWSIPSTRRSNKVKDMSHAAYSKPIDGYQFFPPQKQLKAPYVPMNAFPSDSYDTRLYEEYNEPFYRPPSSAASNMSFHESYKHPQVVQEHQFVPSMTSQYGYYDYPFLQPNIPVEPNPQTYAQIPPEEHNPDLVTFDGRGYYKKPIRGNYPYTPPQTLPGEYIYPSYNPYEPHSVHTSLYNPPQMYEESPYNRPEPLSQYPGVYSQGVPTPAPVPPRVDPFRPSVTPYGPHLSDQLKPPWSNSPSPGWYIRSPRRDTGLYPATPSTTAPQPPHGDPIQQSLKHLRRIGDENKLKSSYNPAPARRWPLRPSPYQGTYDTPPVSGPYSKPFPMHPYRTNAYPYEERDLPESFPTE